MNFMYIQKGGEGDSESTGYKETVDNTHTHTHTHTHTCTHIHIHTTETVILVNTPNYYKRHNLSP